MADDFQPQESPRGAVLEAPIIRDLMRKEATAALDAIFHGDWPSLYAKEAKAKNSLPCGVFGKPFVKASAPSTDCHRHARRFHPACGFNCNCLLDESAYFLRPWRDYVKRDLAHVVSFTPHSTET